MIWNDAPVLLGSLVFAGAFVWYTRRKNALTLDGALTAAGVGLWVLYWAGPVWLLPLFFFFISGTLLGRLNKAGGEAADAKHGQPRDYRQVLCNGGIYALLASSGGFLGNDTALTLMSLSMAVSTSDTWSSETGPYFRQKTVDILRWQPVPAGLSGGVSFAGTAGGFAGALAVAALGSFLVLSRLDFNLICLLTLGGFTGMVLDSLLGASLQARYQDERTGALSDQGGIRRQLYSGKPWMSNDGVNFWSNAIVTLAGYGVIC